MQHTQHPHVARHCRNLRILAAGGDGTVTWLLKTVRELGLDPAPPVAIMPLGTGNDLSLSFGWGNVFLDRWMSAPQVSPGRQPPCVQRV